MLFTHLVPSWQDLSILMQFWTLNFKLIWWVSDVTATVVGFVPVVFCNFLLCVTVSYMLNPDILETSGVSVSSWISSWFQEFIISSGPAMSCGLKHLRVLKLLFFCSSGFFFRKLLSFSMKKHWRFQHPQITLKKKRWRLPSDIEVFPYHHDIWRRCWLWIEHWHHIITRIWDWRFQIPKWKIIGLPVFWKTAKLSTSISVISANKIRTTNYLYLHLHIYCTILIHQGSKWNLVGGWSNPLEKYDSQNWDHETPIFGVTKIQRDIWVATTGPFFKWN